MSKAHKNFYDETLRRVREICLALPDTRQTLTWNKPHFRVKDKIFAGCGCEDGATSVGFKLSKPHAAQIIRKDSSCSPAKYVGKHGWVTLCVDESTDWALVREFLNESYRLIAPKRSIAKLGQVCMSDQHSRGTIK